MNHDQGKMRKYYQAACALTAALSLIALLFYRHEYYKLRFVLQVLNYFGNTQLADKPKNFQCVNSFASNDRRLPSWQLLFDDLHIYSAYYNPHDDEITSIIFGKNTDKFDFISCHVLLDDELKSIPGKFTYKKIRLNYNYDSTDHNHNYEKQFSGYLFNCVYDRNHGKINKTVVGIQFLLRESSNDVLHSELDRLPITPVYSLDDNNYYNTDKSVSNVICISPPIDTTKVVKYADMMTFLAFHNHIGWNHFIAYDYGISPVFNYDVQIIGKQLEDQQKRNFTYTTIPWNFPYSKISTHIMQNIIEMDCIYRSYNRANIAIALAWNEFMNLKYHRSVDNLINDLDKVLSIDKLIDKFQTGTLVLCTSNHDDETGDDRHNMSLPIMLNSATYDTLKQLMYQNQSHYIHRLDNPFNNYPTENYINDLMFINRYGKCHGINQNNNSNGDKINKDRELSKGILRFADYLLDSPLINQDIKRKILHH